MVKLEIHYLRLLMKGYKMIKDNAFLDNLVIDEKDIITAYLYGSFVNGYCTDKSDIDVVIVTDKEGFDPLKTNSPIISHHYVNMATLDTFKSGHSYGFLKMKPLYNEEVCSQISDNLKSELVRRELRRFQKKNIYEFEAFDPFKNYLLSRVLSNPWRAPHTKRILNSPSSHDIINQEYEPILDSLKEKGMIEKDNGKYSINPNFIFDDREDKLPIEFENTLKRSKLGWAYLRNLNSIIQFSSKRI
jgi:predicted nucleotidyltransferase